MRNSRLYQLFRPHHYALHITMERVARRFTGTVEIKGTTTAQSPDIRLHAHKLHIIRAQVDGKPATFEYGDHDSLILQCADLPAGEYAVMVEFEGEITNPMHGLYPCYFTLDGRPEELLATQFESHHAREVFPCIDEPEAKAQFDLTLTTEPNITVLSNTPIKSQEEHSGQLNTSFETTPVMSTYLLAWVAGKLDYQEAATKGGVVVRAYATPDKKVNVRYALDAAVKALEFYDDFFGIPYPLPKCDLVALPDFSSGAMENWGCITFRETTLLVDDHSSTRTRQYVVEVVAHELAHQWFGNLVTMRWWDDLWLNESFANWMEYYVTGQLRPEWEMMTQYYAGQTTYAFERDGLASVQKIQQEVHTPSEIQTLFDPAIVYAKGGSLLNMLHDYIGHEKFRDGLRLYFQRHAYGNTEANDLWRAWSEVSNRDILSFMHPWISQAGFPYVSVDNGSKTVRLTQQRFFSSPSEFQRADVQWPIPLLADGQLREELFDQPATTLELVHENTPLQLNQGRTGYYIIKYSQAHTAKLATLVERGTIPVVDRLGLLNDSLNLSRAGLESLSSSLKLLQSYRNEASYPVWGAISGYIGALKLFADDDEHLLAQTKQFIRSLAGHQFKRLGWSPAESESYFDSRLRPLIIAHMAYAEEETVVHQLGKRVSEAKQPTDIGGDIRATAFAAAVQHGGAPVYRKLLGWYHATTSAEVRTQIIAGLCAAKDPTLIKESLALLTTDSVKLQDLFYWVGNLTQNRFARDLAWQWVKDHWQWITTQFGNDMHYTDFPEFTAAAFSRREQLDAYKAFFGAMLNVDGLSRTIRQGIEDIESRVLWRERDGDAVTAFLDSYAATTRHQATP